jgi:hypothetical protein
METSYQRQQNKVINMKTKASEFLPAITKPFHSSKTQDRIIIRFHYILGFYNSGRNNKIGRYKYKNSYQRNRSSYTE